MAQRLTDTHGMTEALALARRVIGRTVPNPAVGAVVACVEEIVGHWWTKTQGGPHADVIALAGAGLSANDGVNACLQAGGNDLDGTLMNESITRAAGGEHGQELPPARMEEIILSIGQVPNQRTALYGQPLVKRRRVSFDARPFQPVVQQAPSRRYAIPLASGS